MQKQAEGEGRRHDRHVGFAPRNPLGSSSEALKSRGIWSAQAARSRGHEAGHKGRGSLARAGSPRSQRPRRAEREWHPALPRPTTSVPRPTTSSSPKVKSNNPARRTERSAGGPGRIFGSWVYSQHKVLSVFAEGFKASYTLTPSRWFVCEGNGVKGEKGKLFTPRWAPNCCGQLGKL